MEPLTGIQKNYNNNVELADLANGLVCLCRSYRSIAIKSRLFHIHVKVPCSMFNNLVYKIIRTLCNRNKGQLVIIRNAVALIHCNVLLLQQ